jgi:hypothetical protein
MRWSTLFAVCLGSFVVACGGAMPEGGSSLPGASEKGADEMKPMVEELTRSEVLDPLIDELVATHGEEQRARIEAGLRQAAARWRGGDGSVAEFAVFAETHFVSEAADLDRLFARFQDNLEQVAGHLHEIDRFLQEPIHLDRGPVAPLDQLFARYDLAAHLIEDMFRTKIGFVILLNFELFTLEQMLESGGGWSRDQWARARAVELFEARVPPEVEQEITEAFVAADDYIANYNVYMHNLLTEEGERLFPEGLKLISHWGLRDELKAHYGQEGALPRQRMIHRVMERIVAQEIPAAVIDNPDVDWVVATGEVRPRVAGGEVDPAPEPDTRYAMLQDTFKAVKLADPFHPTAPTYILRKFEHAREIPEPEVRALLESVLRAEVLKDVARLIEKRLGRELEPFDIWYDGFAPRGTRSEAELDEIVRRKYPTVEAFQNDLPQILGKLGFDAQTAEFLAGKIVVDPARGAGHAMGAQRREDAAHLRTRFEKDGMNYKGYNIAIHELGHNVEQVFSLNRIDHYMLEGVPNTSFTEGFAFAFQARDIELLGLEDDDPLKPHYAALDTLWTTFEIGGVGMVDIEIWHWMYDHPDATPVELKAAVIQIAKDVWNEYFAPVFGIEDSPLLAIYSHIIDAGMYIPDYPMGLLIQFQMQEYFKQHGLAGEMERMCKLGSLTPDAWMREAVGGPISADPLIAASKEAVTALSAEK